MKNRTICGILMLAVCAQLTLAGCTSETTSTTSVNISKTTDEGTEEYSYTSENKNGEVTVDESDTFTASNGDENEDDPVYQAGAEIDDTLIEEWDDEQYRHRVTYDPDEIFVQVWYEGATTKDDIDEDAFRKDVIPGWQEYYDEWRSELDEKGLKDVDLCLQYTSDNGEDVFFTLEGGALTYFVFD